MTEEKFQILKEEYIDHIKDFITNTGELFPHISLFADVIGESGENDKPALIHIPIPDGYMDSSEKKEELVNQVIPEIAEKVKEQFDTKAIAWSSEAWMRKADKDSSLENWQSLPKKEVVIIMIESDVETTTILYEIKRKGKQVDKHGDLIDIVELVLVEDNQPDKVEGIFSGLLKKFK